MLRFVLALILLCGPAWAGSRVPAADLAAVDAQALDELRATEFEVFLADVALHAAKRAEELAAAELREARRGLQAEVLDLKAARAEARAAEAHTDESRRAAARDSIRQASRDKETNDLLIEWKEKSLRVARLTIEQMRLRQQLAEARQDLARAQALQTSAPELATRYPVASYEREALQLQKSYDNAIAKTSKATNEEEALAARWSRRTGD